MNAGDPSSLQSVIDYSSRPSLEASLWEVWAQIGCLPEWLASLELLTLVVPSV